MKPAESDTSAPGTARLGRSVHIAGIGSYAPERVLTNQELEKMVDTTDEWILTRSGIRERHIAAPGQATSDLGVEAARAALADAGLAAGDVDLILVATASPDMLFPSTACQLQHKLGARKVAAFDLSAACSGFIYALEVGRQFVASGTHDTVLVVGADKLSAITDWTDRATCVLFGDAAGAAVLRHEPGRRGILSTHLGADGSQKEILNVPAGGSAMPATEQTVRDKMHFIRMSGREVFKLAVNAMLSAARGAVEKSGLALSDINCVIPHQANMRIIEAISDRLKVGMDRFHVNLQHYGNTSAASIPVALAEAVRMGKVKRGDNVLLVAFGGGLTWGSAVIHW
ncbi:MAG TPA: beta-ketoacyl-ACP synthase III [Verrucomicrobiae bacterium]|nr:beta-ketoacyl-ACP synthase III [Verrucomicrobiae bacterium]